MKKKLTLLSLTCILCAITYFKLTTIPEADSSPHNSQDLPAPTEITIKWDMEEGDKKSQREKYFEMVHGGPDVDWQSIERQNAFDLLEEKRMLRLLNDERSEEEWVAGGNVKGKWIERGSSNQAGNITTTAYDPVEDEVFGIGGGGPIFKGTTFGAPWDLVNDDLRFTSGLLQIAYPAGQDRRLIAAIGAAPYYSDDEGETWIKASGVREGGYIYDQCRLTDGRIFLLQKDSWWGDLKVIKTEDYGETWTEVKRFSTSDKNNIVLKKSIDSDDVFVMEQLDVDRSRLWTYDLHSQQLALLNDRSSLAFGERGRANLIVQSSDSLRFYIYDEDNGFYVTADTGNVWTQMSTLSTRPWAVGVFMAGSDPSKLIYGEVNSHRSQNGGKNWLKINDWWEYYRNVEFKLHADIMCIDEYYTQDGEPFILIGNHGGVSITTDYGVTNQNIGMIGLNVGQFYDVKSYPPNKTRFFGGTQDQGLQKGKMSGEEADDFIQIISGDYGHLQFTGPEQEHLWTVYPGGAVGYYNSPLTQSRPSFGYEIESLNETVWIPPTMTSADPSRDIIYIAGGSVNSNSDGSHIIKLTASNNQIEAEDLPYDFSVSGGTIASMAISPFDPNLWYVMTTNGSLYQSTDGGLDFSRLRRSLPGSQYLYGSCILPSKLDPNVLYISGNGYGASSSVYKSENGGLNWSLVSRGMPETTTFKVAANEDESLIFAATEAGPYVWIEQENLWFSLAGETTPNQTFWSVEYIEELKIARFSTYGRGVWDFEVTSQTPTSTKDVSSEDIELSVYPNPTLGLITVNTSLSDGALLQVINSNGQMISKTTYTGANNQVDLRTYPAGRYIITVQDGSTRKSKLVIKN